ncbi:MAG: esterase [Cyanobacteria bacterium RYN_339]|nr:esterase [Cyanobacteria bacterium RYN_339]
MKRLGIVLSIYLAVAATGCAHALVAGAAVPAAGLRAAEAGFTTRTVAGRTYKLYVPAGYRAGTPAPLVVMLHGCTQDPDDFAAGTHMNAVADRERFLVAYPLQPKEAHQMKCWRWFDPADQVRGSGEPASIVAVTQDVSKRYAVDANAVFVAGLSAGGAMTAILGATYPDVFAAIGVGSGLEFQAAKDESAARVAMNVGGPNPAPDAFKAMGAAARVLPVIVFHGGADRIVAPINGKQIATQFAKADDQAGHGIGLDDTPDQSLPGQAPGGEKFTRAIYQDGAGHPVIETYTVDAMGHAWSGGDAKGSYTDPKGPDASAIMWDFFKAHRKLPVARSSTKK